MDIYHTDDLFNNNFNELSKFTFSGLITKAKIINVYDGDTVTIVFYFKDEPVKYNFRMLGYDSPEIKPMKNIQHRELHKQSAICAKQFLEHHIRDKIVWVKFSCEEKYGRLMGELFLIDANNKNHFSGHELCVNNMMIEKGFGKRYDGCRKSIFSEDELIQIINTYNSIYTCDT